MIRNGQDYRESIRDGREVFINGEKVKDVTQHPMFKPLVDVRARIYDMAHEDATKKIMTYTDEAGEQCAIGNRLPYSKADWEDKRRATNAVFEDIGGVVIRVGDETVGEMWSLFDGQNVLDEVDPQFSANIRTHIDRVIKHDLFHVSANTDPKGDRSKLPQDQDPDMLLHAVKETDKGIIVRGAKYETAAAYANQAFTKPTIANWGDAKLSDYAVGFICDLNSQNLKFICRSGFAGASGLCPRADQLDYPLSNKFDEIDYCKGCDHLVSYPDALVWTNIPGRRYGESRISNISYNAEIDKIEK